MSFFGLHIADWAIIVVYVGVLLSLGKLTASRVHGQSDFFLAGRSLGKVFQFFLNFGNMTDAASAVRTSSVVYSQGVGGVWISFQTLFMTPYYWFMNPWFRRARLTTIADLFIDRFDSKFLAMLYAVTAIVSGTVAIGGGYLVAYKILDIFIVKPEAAYTAKERHMVEQFREYTILDTAYKQGALAPASAATYQELRARHARGELRSHISYVKPLPVYVGFALLVGMYVVLGGLKAAALTDVLQSFMIVIFSVILLPFGLYQLGGVHAFQEHLPTHMLDLFGSGGGSDFAWYSVVAILLVSIIQIHAESTNMTVAGSARDEAAARFGAVGGGFAKRFMIVAWCFCGLIAFALFGPGLSDPDGVWGALCRSLLGPGLFGLMLAGILSAEMTILSAQSLATSALFVRNFYKLLFPQKSEAEYLMMGRILIGVTLAGGIGVALLMNDLLAFVKTFFTLNLTFGAAIMVLFKWNRITRSAMVGGVVIALLVIVVIPLTTPIIPALSKLPALHLMTRELRETEQNGRTTVIPPKPLFFEHIIPADPTDPASATHGSERFHLEIYLISCAGFDLTGLKPAQLLTVAYLFDCALPFALFFGFSLFTRETNPERARRFYAKMRTRVVPEPAEDARRLSEAQQDLGSSEKTKLFPGSSWELLRWNRQDALGFLACCAIAAGILGGFATLLSLART